MGDMSMGAVILFLLSFSLIIAEDSYLLELSITYMLNLLSALFPLLEDFEL